jgi:hypothetical protein
MNKRHIYKTDLQCQRAAFGSKAKRRSLVNAKRNLIKCWYRINLYNLLGNNVEKIKAIRILCKR